MIRLKIVLNDIAILPQPHLSLQKSNHIILFLNVRIKNVTNWWLVFIFLKSYAGYMVKFTEELVQSLQNAVESNQTEVEIGEYITRLTADIISRTEFDTSYEKGKQIFHLLTDLQRRCAQATRNLYLPGSR